MVWSRPLNDPKAEWRRDDSPVHPRAFTGAGDWLYGMDLKRNLIRRRGADPTAPWETIGRVPDGDGRLHAAGNQLWWFGDTAGPVLARPASGVEVEWQVIGHVRSPSVR